MSKNILTLKRSRKTKFCRFLRIFAIQPVFWSIALVSYVGEKSTPVITNHVSLKVISSSLFQLRILQFNFSAFHWLLTLVDI